MATNNKQIKKSHTILEFVGNWLDFDFNFKSTYLAILSILSVLAVP